VGGDVIGDEVGVGHAIVVALDQDRRPRGPHRHGARGGDAPPGLAHDREVEAVAEAVEHRGGVVGRAVVDDHHLEVGAALAGQGGEGARQRARSIAGRDHQASARHHRPEHMPPQAVAGARRASRRTAAPSV
jgi:hypothetical protein